jgi:hypothetical protein
MFSRAVRFEVTGGDAVARRMRELGRSSSDMRKVFDELGREIVADARVMAPKRSGALAGSIRAKARRSGVTVASGLPYSGPQEYGWRRRGIDPHRFMTTAADSKEQAAVDNLDAEVRRLIREAGLS